MVARQVGQLAVVDEDGGAAVLRHQRVGQRQRRVRDVGAADVEGPGHRVAVRQHQRVDPELVDLEPDPLELFGFDLAGKLRAMNRTRGRAAGPGARSTPGPAGCCRPRPVPRRPWCRRRPDARLPQKCAATGQNRGGRRRRDAWPASVPAADRPAARYARPCGRPAWRPAACSGHRRKRRPRASGRWPCRPNR